MRLMITRICLTMLLIGLTKEVVLSKRIPKKDRIYVITGKVVDHNDTQESLWGAIVNEYETPNMTFTDCDGRYTIKSNHRIKKLLISFYDYKSIIIKCRRKKVINISLEEKGHEINDHWYPVYNGPPRSYF
ncbi:carboxypeptidase-like regulatory domain-containing protein [Prolixibacteraceae bacterium]|nr:carboxypeptidase-like regulatory domain-containing protein [Prolixibacteraceae bacterium]